MPDELKDVGKMVAATANDQQGAAGQKDQSGAGQTNVVTVDFLKAWGDAQNRKVTELVNSVAQQHVAFKEEIAKTFESFKPAQPPEESDAKKQKAQSLPELVEMRKELEGTKRKIAEYEKTIADANERERSFRFSTRVKEALTKSGCVKVEQAFRVIRDDLKHDDSADRIFATVEMEGQQVELDVDKYVSSIVKEKLLPEFFSGNHRQGSPASGGGSAGKDYDFTEEQCADTEFYKANRDKIAEAFAKGRVKKRQRQ